MAKCFDRWRDHFRELERVCGSGGGPREGSDLAADAEREHGCKGGHYSCRAMLALAAIGVIVTAAFAAFGAPVDRGLTGNGIDGRSVSAGAGAKDASQAVDNYVSRTIPTVQVVGPGGRVGTRASHRGSGQWGQSGGGYGTGLGSIGNGGRTGDSGRDW